MSPLLIDRLGWVLARSWWLSRVRRIVGSKPEHRTHCPWSSLSLIVCVAGAVLVSSVASRRSLAETGDVPERVARDVKRQVVEVRLVGGPKQEPLPKVKVEFTSGHGSDKKSFGTFTTDDAGWLKATLPAGFYYLHLSSAKEWPYLPYEKYWTESSFGYGKALNVNVTDSTAGVEKWLGGERREQGFEAATKERPARITFSLQPAVELVLRAVDIETGKGIPGAEFYEEVAVGEDWAHPIYGDNLGTKFGYNSKALTGLENLTDHDGYARRWVGEKSEQSQFGVWKAPASYELVEPKGEVAVVTKLGQASAAQVFKFRRIGREPSQH